MLRVFFGVLLATTLFVGALLLAAEWVIADRPATWLALLAGDAEADMSEARVATGSPPERRVLPVVAVTPLARQATRIASAPECPSPRRAP